MNWKLIFGLSLFGLAMAFATISVVPQNVEPLAWLAIFILCAYIIAAQCTGKYFLHGFLVSLVNCVWITCVHVLFYSTYIAHHPDMAAMNAKIPPPLGNHPRLLMVIGGPIAGVVCGLILGLFAFIASKLVKKQSVTAGAS